VLGAMDVAIQEEAQGKVRNVATAVAISNGIVLIDNDGKPLANIPYHYDTTQYAQIRIGAAWPGDRIFIWYNPSSKLGARALKMPSYVVEISPSGKENARTTLPPLSQPQALPRWHERMLSSLIPLVVYIVATIVSLVKIWLGYSDGEMEWASMREQFHHDPTGAVIVILTLLTITVATAVITLRITRRYAFSTAGRRFWTVMAVFVGPAALFTLLGLHQWPALVPCPSCNKRRRVDRDRCPDCGQPFPPQEVRPGDIYDSESPQGSNEPAHPATLVPSV